MSVLENLRLYAGLYSLSKGLCGRVEETLDFAGLADRRSDLVRTLSGGRRQKLALGCAMLHKPEILFLDEPTGGVDPASRLEFWGVISEIARLGTTVMITTHFMDEAEHCDKVAFIYRGKLIADDAPSRLREKIPGLMFEISGPETMPLLGKIRSHGRLPLMDANFFGKSLRVLLRSDYNFSRDPLFDGYSVLGVRPSMEDVFAYLARTGADAGR
jgi:ABC-2 type transport system ATP-binding protein